MKQIRVHVVEQSDRRHLTLRWTDPRTNKRRTESAGTRNKRQAERAAADKERHLNHGRGAIDAATWDDFRLRFEREHLQSLASGTVDAYSVALNSIEGILDPQSLDELDGSAISRFQAELRRRPVAEATIASYLRHIGAALRWAVTVDMLAEAPKITFPKRARNSKHMRGRPLVAEEFEKMLAVTPRRRPHDAARWQRYLTGLWLSGLRLSESLRLSWDAEADIRIVADDDGFMLAIQAEGQKAFRDELLPLAPEFEDFLLDTPKRMRYGLVFDLPTRSKKEVSLTVSGIGEQTNIVVERVNDKDRHPTAHDLRRSFGTRWASRVMPADLMALMRHADVKTTMSYYVQQDARGLRTRLREARQGSTKVPAEAISAT